MQIHEITSKKLEEGILKGVADVLKTAATRAAFRYGASQTGVNLAPYFPEQDSENVVRLKDTKGVYHTYTKSGEKWYDEANKEADPATSAMLNDRAKQQAQSKPTTPAVTEPDAATTAPVGPGVMPQTTVTPSKVSYTDVPTAKKHTGGKVAGTLSQTPGAIRKRAARLANKNVATEPSAMASMANQLTTKPVKTSTGGTMVKTPTGLVHTAKAAAPIKKTAPKKKKTQQEPKWTGRRPKDKKLADYYRALGLIEK